MKVISITGYLSILEFPIILWALVDSIFRWKKYKSNNIKPNGYVKISHKFLPIHYIATFLGLILWSLSIGEIGFGVRTHFFIKLFGLVLTMTGWLITFMGRQTLATNWSPDVYVIDNRSKINSGLYSYVKHPIYFGEFLFFSGIGIFTENIISMAVIILPTTLYNIYRGNKE